MKQVLHFTLIASFLWLFTPAFSEKVIDWEAEFSKVEKEYLKGDYKKALQKSLALVKKIEKKNGNENLVRARALSQLAKIYEASSKLEDYKTTIDLSLNTINLSPKENSNEHGKALSWATEAFIQYGDFAKAQETIQKAMTLVEAGKISDLVIVNEIKSKQAIINFNQGYLIKAENALPDLINFRKSRVVSKEPYTDDKGRTKSRKLSKTEVSNRTRSAIELMSIYSLVTLENGNYTKTDSILESNAIYIKKHFSKKDVAFIENNFQKGLLLEALQKHHDANDKFDRVGKKSVQSKGIRLKPMSKQTIRYQEKRILSHKKVKRDAQANKREKIHRTRVVRTYGKNSVYYAKYRLIEAEDEMFSKEYKKAESRVNEVLNNPLYFPKNHPERIKALKILYNISLETDQYEKAEKCLNEILEIRKNLNGMDVPAYHLANLDLANFHVAYSSKFKNAEEIYSTSFDKVKNEIDHRYRRYLDYTYSYSDLFEYTDRFEKSLEILNTAIEDTKKYYGERHPKYASALERTANVYIDLGRYADAEKNLTTSQEIFKNEGSTGDYKDYSHALETFARLYIIQGEYDEAKRLLKKSVQKQEYVGAEVKLSGTIDELATLYIETGKYQETEKSLKQALKLKEAKYGQEHRTLVNPLNQLGHLYLITGNYIEAEKLTKRAASISLKIFGENSIKYAESLKLQGEIYSSIGDYEKAEDATEKALQIQKHQYGENHIQIAMSLNDIALIKYYNNGDPNEVEKLLLEALRMTKESLNDQHPQYASTLYHLALFYLETGNIEKSSTLLDQANVIWVAKFGENNRHSAEIYFIKGNISSKKENYAQAKIDYTTSKNIYQRVFDNTSHPGYLSAVSRIGQMSYIIGDYKDAIKNLDESTSNYLAFIQKYFPSLSEREKTKFWTKIQNDFEFYNTLVVKLKDENPTLISNSYNFALSTKALLLNSSIKVRHRILESKDQELIDKFEQWQAKKEFLTSAFSMTTEQRKESEIDLKTLETEIETLEKELSDKSQVFAENFQKKTYDWRDIRKNLAENEAAIEIIRFRHFNKSYTDTIMYAALIVTPETRSNPNIILLKNGKELEEKWLKYYRNCMKFNVEDKHSYENFWKPIKENIKDNTVIYLSPEGVYNQINLETLSNNDKFVLDQNEIVLVSNTRDLITRKKEVEKSSKSKKNATENNDITNKIILFGNPIYYSKENFSITDSATNAIDSIDVSLIKKEIRKLSQLPGAEKEVKDLNDLLNKGGWNSVAFLNENATEARLKDLKDIKVFHIATHGFFMEDVDASSDLEGINQNRAIQNPLHRSGLLLKDGGYLIEHDNVYEFNSSDGILTAYEAMNLNFDNTDLVVLSACETGLGKVQLGEGVYGLQRSFLVAGSKTIVMSLFKVNDEVTQELMNLFYTNWIKTGDKRKAFIDAKKAIKDKYQKPIYWGAFIMIGLD